MRVINAVILQKYATLALPRSALTAPVSEPFTRIPIQRRSANLAPPKRLSKGALVDQRDIVAAVVLLHRYRVESPAFAHVSIGNLPQEIRLPTRHARKPIVD